MTKRRFVAEGRRDPSTPEPEASAVASVRGHKTEETAGGGEELETDTEVGSTEEERDEAHAIRPEKGQGTSMPTQEPREANADNGRMGLGGSRRERYGLGFPPRPKISRSLPLAHTGGCAVRWGRMS